MTVSVKLALVSDQMFVIVMIIIMDLSVQANVPVKMENVPMVSD